MAMRAWRVWAVGVALVGGLSVAARPPELPGKVDTDGKVPSPLAQQHHQVDSTPAPRLLPTSVLDPKPRHGPTTADGSFPRNVIGLDAPEIPAADAELREFERDLARDLDQPIRFSSFASPDAKRVTANRSLVLLLKVRAAFDQAESHFDDCEPDEARPWYEEVIRLAPTTRYAKVAEERLRCGKVFPAGPGQSREPPSADGPEPPRPIPAGTAGRIY